MLLFLTAFSNYVFPKVKIHSALGIKITQLDQKKIGEKCVKYYYVHRKGVKEISFGIYWPDEENKSKMYILLSKKSFDKRKFVDAKFNANPKVNDYPIEILDEKDLPVDIKIVKIDPEDMKQSIEDIFGKRKLKFGTLYEITSLVSKQEAQIVPYKLKIKTRNGCVEIDL
mgnify:CR=1 FL=1|jgi:hypothetical protein